MVQYGTHMFEQLRIAFMGGSDVFFSGITLVESLYMVKVDCSRVATVQQLGLRFIDSMHRNH